MLKNIIKLVNLKNKKIKKTLALFGKIGYNNNIQNKNAEE